MFEDRIEAGKLLAKQIKKLKIKDAVVLGLARGGVVVAWQIANILKVPLDVIVSKKLGAPNNPELAIGAISSLGKPYLEEDLILSLHIDDNYVSNEARKQRKLAKDKEGLYRKIIKKVGLKDRNVILVDDGIATGATILAAIMAVLKSKPSTVTAAIPVAPPSAIEKIKKLIDKVVVLKVDEDFKAVGQFYKKFGQIEDEEVIRLLA